MTQCEVCQGRRLIRLPLRKPMSVMAWNPKDVPAMAEQDWRDYPCPECSDKVPLERVAVLDAHCEVRADINDHPYIEAAKSHAAHSLVEHLLRSGYIRFERGPTDEGKMTFPTIATLGVVAPTRIATLEARIAERQEEFANEVVRKAARGIENWGSAYGHTSIAKGQAIDTLHDALRVVLAEQAALKPMP